MIDLEITQPSKKNSKSRKKKQRKEKDFDTLSGIELGYGEHVVLLVRQHWVVFRISMIIAFLLPLLLLTLSFLVGMIGLPSIAANLVGQITLYGAIILFIFGSFKLAWKYYLWKKTKYILTNKRIVIITQNSIFSHDDREAGLSMIQDVRAQVDGLQATMYGFGNVIVQVSSEDARLILEKVSKPKQIQHAIVSQAHLM